MKAFVHFLVRNPSSPRELIYPDEIGDPNYHGYPGFYLLGDDSRDLLDLYAFPAVHRGVTISTSLRRAPGAITIYLAEAPGVGAFEFRATAIGGARPWVGGASQFSGQPVLRQLKPKFPRDLNRAVIESDFYFVGYSRRIVEELVSG